MASSKRYLPLSICLIVTSASIVFTPHLSAAPIRSGMNCSKADAVRSVKFQGETYVYKCAKNPRYKKTRLTWTLEECLAAIKDYKENLARINAMGASATSLDTDLLGLAKQLRNMSCKAGI